jgi:type II secretory pathway pseudopilin PulG
MEQGYTIGHPITVIGKFKQPVTPGNVQGITSTPTPTPTSPSTPSPSPSPSELTPVKSPSSLDPDDLLVQSTGLPVLITEFKDDDTYCIISPKTFKEIVEEEAKGVNKWKWIVIGSTSIVGGVIAFRIWRHYRRRRRREEEAQRSEEQERLQAATVPENPGILDMLRDIMNWLIMDDPYDIDINRTPSFIAPTPITEYIPEPIPIDPNDNTETPTENQNGTSSTGQNNTNPSTSTGNDGNDSTPTNDENLCVVCLTEKREYAYLPCRHLCVCHHCVHYLEKCPLCRSPIHSYMKIFS